METVNTYLKRYNLSARFSRFSALVRGRNKIARTVRPIQIFDCAVKYNRRFRKCEYPSFCARIRLSATPPSDENTVRYFKVCERAFFIYGYFLQTVEFLTAKNHLFLCDFHKNG